MAIVVAEKLFEMFVIIVVGFAAFRFRLIDAHSNQRLSNLLLMIVSPCLIFDSYQIEFRQELFSGLLYAVGAAALTYVVCIGLSEVMISRKKQDSEIEKIAAVYSNCGFIGLPLIDGILGAKGVFYMTAYITVFNILIWTHGLAVIGASGNLRTLCRNLCTPAIIAILLGVVCFLLRFRVPEVLGAPIEMIGNMNTPVAMIVAGANLAQSDILKSLKNPRVYYISFLKLVLLPLASLAVLALLPVEFDVLFSIFIAVACPTGAMEIMFAERYGKNARYATELFIITTVMSVVTIPLLAAVAGWVL